jgi:hypothetical protein
MQAMNAFTLTSDVLSMAKEYGRRGDIIKSGNTARLKTTVFNAVMKELAVMNKESMAEILNGAVEFLVQDFQSILSENLGLTLQSFIVEKRPLSEDRDPEEESLEKRYDITPIISEDEEYHITLTVPDHTAISLNITKLGAVPSERYVNYITEKPILCWLLDSRSPFYNEDFSMKLKDVAVIMKFQELYTTSDEFCISMIDVLKHSIVGDAH